MLSVYRGLGKWVGRALAGLVGAVANIGTNDADAFGTTTYFSSPCTFQAVYPYIHVAEFIRVVPRRFLIIFTVSLSHRQTFAQIRFNRRSQVSSVVENSLVPEWV
jgi:hypothetical protein